MRELQKGEVVEGFVVKDRIGHGGMGDVYLVHDEKLAVDRALKLISLTGPGFSGSKAEVTEYRARFLREARTLARLRHPNIVAVHATGELDGDPFLVMTYFPSKDARHWLAEEAPTTERIRGVALQAARALAYAHENGVLHRDIKLANLLIGARDEAMLIDFGLAKSAGDSDLTRTGRSMGTFAYLAPEYVKASTTGKPKHTVATDLWAFGCLLYAMTCGEPAFRDKNEIKLLRLIARAQFVPVKTRAPSVPDEWATLIHQLLEPDPARRMPSAAELVLRLERAAPRPAPSPVRLPPPVPADGDAANDAAAPESRLGANAREEGEDDDANEDGDASLAPDEGSSIFDHGESVADEAEGGNASEAFLQPSFQQPPERPTSDRMNARRSIIIPFAAALAVLIGGGALILASGRLNARGDKRSSYVDPEELKRQKRGREELDALARERDSRVNHNAQLTSMTVPMFTTPPADAPEPAPTKPKVAEHRARKSSPPTTATAPSAPDPWAQRYGKRTNFNSSSGPPTSTTTAASASPASATAAAGVRIPVRVSGELASAPLGPVIAIVQAATKIGDVEIPRGAELHGRVTGAEGPRILLEFSFATVNGKNVLLKGSALGNDGRAGVPGAKNVGGASDIAAGAAGGAAHAIMEGAVVLVDNDAARGALRGATSPTVGKATRFDNEEQLVVAAKGSRFFVYIEALR